MIKSNSDNLQSKRAVKAVGLISGGLDSALAAKIMHEMQVEVHGVYFAMPWGCCNKEKAMEVADNLGISLIILQLNERYLDIIKKPKHGYGAALNPCVDCRVHMFKRAGEYMRQIGADFVFTGEVLGQRPMSQMRPSMRIIENEANLSGRLLRPLCAQLMEETIAEQQGLIDRAKLLGFSGRSRREQMQMADKFGIKDYLPPAGGCLLTDKNFARRMRDTFQHGYRNFRETISLKWGRHFRLSGGFKAILGRDKEENDHITAYAHRDDYILELPDRLGPTLVLKGEDPSEKILQTAAGLIQRFSRHKDKESIEIKYWSVKNKNNVCTIKSRRLGEEEVQAIKI